MAMIYVKAVEGRRSVYEARDIPHDKFVPVPFNAFFRRLIDHHKDVIVKDEAAYEELKKQPFKKTATAR